MSEWQKIETAPKDGTDILTYPHYRVTSWVGPEEAFGDEGGWHGRWDEDFEAYWLITGATHWMPLPIPPSDERK